MWHCSSLSGKMDLFVDLLQEITSFFATSSEYFGTLIDYLRCNNDELFDFSKFFIDMHEHSDDSFLKKLYEQTNFMSAVSKCYQAICFKLFGKRAHNYIWAST